MPDAFDKIPNDLINMLRFFIEQGNFSYVDRIGNTLSREAIEMAIKDALRDLNSYYLGAKTDSRGFKYITDRNEKPKTLPRIPSRESINAFFQLIQEDVSYGRRLAMLALSWSSKSETNAKNDSS